MTVIRECRVTFFVLIIGISVSSVLCSKEQAQGKPATASSVHNSNWTADKAVDGNANTNIRCDSCLHTQQSPSPAFLRVDLEGMYTINRLEIFFAQTDPGACYPNGTIKENYKDRSRLYTVLITNTTSTPVHQCYRDNTMNVTHFNLIQNNTCQGTGRYISIEQRHISSIEGNAIHGPLLLICELRVFGCPRGNYGDECNINCSSNCIGETCDPDTGTCRYGCRDGWHGDKCVTECRDGTYGKNCSLMCGRCRDGVPCNKTTGLCLNGECDRGYKGEYCKTVCSDGEYGFNCRETCGSCRNGLSCNKTSGHCPNTDCERGFFGNLCKTECDNTYGYNCNETCGFCRNSSSCDTKYGNCSRDECDRGYQGPMCKTGCKDGKYGYNCKEICGFCKDNDVCDKALGSCPDGHCELGYTGYTCKEECSDGMFGYNCMNHCGVCLNGSTCDKRHGNCSSCEDGYTGVRCLPDIQKSGESSPVNQIPSVVGGSFGAVVAIVLIVIVSLFVHRRRFRPTKESSRGLTTSFNGSNLTLPKTMSGEEEGNFNLMAKSMQDNEKEENIYANALGVDSYCIPIHILDNVIAEKSKDEDELFKEEFCSLPSGQLKPCSAAELLENKTKNRFRTTFPYDDTRVDLRAEGEEESDYINASYIKDMQGKKMYIAAQGPKDHTAVDFWRMIWQVNVSHIVMLTNLQEGQKKKCARYWPAKNTTVECGPFIIKNHGESAYANFAIRQLTVTDTRSKSTKQLTHFHYTTWPDHGTPNTLSLVIFYERVRRTVCSVMTSSPLLVHCSAGIGRTGTFIALDALLRHSKDSQNINVFQYIKQMREEDRMNMIQTVDQYAAIHYLLQEALRSKFYPIHKSRLREQINKMRIPSQPANQNILRKYMTELSNLKPKYEHYDFEGGLNNPDLNMDNRVLPVEKYRPYLNSRVKGRSDFINAVFMPTQQRSNAIIVSNFPTRDTGVDLLRLLVDHGSLLVVLGFVADEQKNWLPSHSSALSLDPFSVKRGEEKASGSSPFDESDITITREGDPSSRTLGVLHAKDWPVKTSDALDMSVVIKLVKTTMERMGNDKTERIIVLSRDGVQCCDVFCAVYNAVEQLLLDDEVDIFNIVRQLQIRRPQFFPSVEEYKLVLQAVLFALPDSDNNIYANT